MTQNLSKDLRINSILDAAIEEFLEKGYEGASMEAIARRAGLSKGGLYHHFKNKDDVLMYANEKLAESIMVIIQEIKSCNTNSEMLSTYIDKYIRYWSIHPKEMQFYFLSMTKAFQNESFKSLFENYTEYMLDFFEAIYKSGIEKDEFIIGNARDRAFALISALDGSVAYIHLDTKLSLDSIIKMFCQLYIDSFKTK
jgi:AcrR family transcriptional regulator